MAVRFRETGDGRIWVPSRGAPPAPPEGYQRMEGNPYMFRPISPITNQEETDQELYQHLYEDGMLNYGSAKHNRCPGVKFFEFYKHWLGPCIYDFGCGRGDTVRMLCDKGYKAYGIDQVDLDNGMDVGDITKPLCTAGFDTGICIDVFEHLVDEDLEGLLLNMSHTEKQVISVHTGPAFEIGCKVDLHINKKSFDEWRAFISRHLTVVEFKQLGKQRGLFFCQG